MEYLTRRRALIVLTSEVASYEIFDWVAKGGKNHLRANSWIISRAITVLFWYNFYEIWDMNSTSSLELNIQGNKWPPPLLPPCFCHDCLIFFPEKNHFPKLVQGAPILLRSSTSLQKRERTICSSLLAHWLIPGFHIFSSDRGEMQFSTGSSVKVHNFIVIRNLSVRFPLMLTVLIIIADFRFF